MSPYPFNRELWPWATYLETQIGIRHVSKLWGLCAPLPLHNKDVDSMAFSSLSSELSTTVIHTWVNALFIRDNGPQSSATKWLNGADPHSSLEHSGSPARERSHLWVKLCITAQGFQLCPLPTDRPPKIPLFCLLPPHFLGQREIDFLFVLTEHK